MAEDAHGKKKMRTWVIIVCTVTLDQEKERVRETGDGTITVNFEMLGLTVRLPSSSETENKQACSFSVSDEAGRWNVRHNQFDKIQNFSGKFWDVSLYVFGKACT